MKYLGNGDDDSTLIIHRKKVVVRYLVVCKCNKYVILGSL